HAVLEDFGFLIHYHSFSHRECACAAVRNFRPFCCRIFPYRPVIDESVSRVVDLVKVGNEKFSPCWIESPLSQWRSRAIEAWNYVLADRVNRQFYAQYYYCLKQSECSDASFFQALEEDEIFHKKITSLTDLPDAQLWQLCQQFFTYNG